MHLATPGNMPLMGGTLRAPSLHLIIPSLRFSYALSTKHFSSVPSAHLNPTPKPLSSLFFPVSSQRQSIEHSPSNPTKPRLNQTKPPNKRLERPKPSPDAGLKREAVVTMKNKQKEYHLPPAGLLEKKLHHCLKHGQIVKALRLYDTAVACGIPLSVCHYNYLLQLCSLPSSSSSIADVTSEAADVSNGEGDGGSDITLNDAETEFSDPEIRKMVVERGFEIYTRMCEDPGVEPNEATFTFLDRLKTQRLSIKHPASNPTKSRPNQAIPPNKTPKNPEPSTDATAKRESVVSVKKKRREYRDSPTGLLQRDLDQCSKRGHTVRALELYDSAVAAGTPLSIRHYNCLLYLCSLPSSSSSIADSTTGATGVGNGEGDGGSDVTSNDAEAKFNDPEISKMAVERGFEIYRRMCEDPSLEPNEATFTSMARLAAMKGDPHMAFDLVKQTLKRGMPIRLRSYGPALHGFCDLLDVEMAHEVETHMDAHGVLFLFCLFLCTGTCW